MILLIARSTGTRDMAFSHHPVVGLPGVQDRDDGPFAPPLEQGDLQEKRSWGPQFAPLGAAMDRLLSHAQQVLPQRGTAFAHHRGGPAARGSMITNRVHTAAP
jgi:hypothetical protein